MIQVDVFWTFAIGAQMAALSGKQLKLEPSVLVNEYFLYCVCFLSLLFAPSGMYLLWMFPGWESMFMLNRELITGTMVALFSSTNTFFGILGFVSAATLAKKDKLLLSHSIWVIGYVIMFGILGFGYRRFTFAGNSEDWESGTDYPFIEFIYSKVFSSLLIMGLFIIPTLYYPIISWPAACGSTKSENKIVFRRILLTAFLAILIGAIGYFIWLQYISTPEQALYCTMKDFDFEYEGQKFIFGAYSPLVGYFITQLTFWIIVLFPFLLQKSKNNKKKKN